MDSVKNNSYIYCYKSLLDLWDLWEYSFGNFADIKWTFMDAVTNTGN
jgi:hypothetical protein